MATETRGNFVLGLQPDDRMPNDWLRMVARVFAAYRKRPLEKSIVAYIDGLNLELFDENETAATVKITPGQCFIDDQFIGFETESFLTFSKTVLNIGEKYCVTLTYQWINQMPPQEPHYVLMSKTVAEGSQQAMCLGYIVKQADGSLVIEDYKRPWYLDMLDSMVKNTEVDGREYLPYLVAVKEDETYDIGWALDFHHNVGNNIDYNTRLHTDRQTDGELYVNGRRIITARDLTDPNNPEDPVDPGDTYTIFNNNITVEETNVEGSNSGKVCYSLRINPSDTNAPSASVKGASWCFDVNTVSTTLQNLADFNDANSSINRFTLTSQEDIVTINGHPIWHQGNLASSGKSIYFLGVYDVGDTSQFPTERINGDPLQDGDTLYNTSYHAYFYFQNNEWTQVGKSESVKQYEFSAIEGQTSVKCHYNPNFVVVTVSGIVLSRSDYVASDGEYIIFNRELEEGEIVTVSTVLSGQGLGLSVEELADVSLVNLEEFDVLTYHNGQWINRPIAPGSIGDINDVSLSTVNNRDILVYDDTTHQWKNEEYPVYRLDELQNVTLTDPQVGEILQLKIVDSSVAWVNVDAQDLISQSGGVPTGSIIAHASNTVPDGYLECNGAAISRTTFSRLYNAIGTTFGVGDGNTTFNIPDLRGEFIRGWDHGRGVDLNRNFASSQGDAMRPIQGSFIADDKTTQTTGAFFDNGSSSSNQASGNECCGRQISFDSSRVVPSAPETRPRNIALMYIIKY